MKRLSIALFVAAFLVICGVAFYQLRHPGTDKHSTDSNNQGLETGVTARDMSSLSIDSLRKGNYPGSDIVIEETLIPGSNYKRYIASYKSEGYKIYALLTVPEGDRPKSGWPVVIFNHGYIPPAEYATTERYLAYTDAFSSAGYIVFKSDYRGHGESEGPATGAYGSNGYTIDVLNAISSMRRFKDPSTGSGQVADPARIGLWGHSLGGFVSLRALVVDPKIKAAVIWAGVVGSYPDLLNNWRRSTFTPPPLPSGTTRRWRQQLVEEYGTPEENPAFWASISANSYVKDISAPIQLHHGTADSSVPVEFSQKLEKQLKEAGKTVQLYTYPGDDHNIAANFGTAAQRSVEFFDKYLK